MDSVIVQVFLFCVAVLAGLGLITLGTRFLSEGLQLLLGVKIRRVINWLDQSDAVASLVGALTSLMIQSRISSSVMSVSYANSRLMNLRQMAFFLLGATVGTFLTPWIFLLDSYRLDLYLLAFGVLPMMHARWDKLAGLGRMVFAVGLMLLGFDVIAFGATQPDVMAMIVRKAVNGLPGGPAGLVILALPFCFLVRSTVAQVAMVMALVFSGILEANVAIALTIGFNLGAVIPALVSARNANSTAFRGVVFWALSYVLAVLVLLIGFETFVSEVLRVSENLGSMSSTRALNISAAMSVPFAHLAVNILAMIVGFTLSPFVEALTGWFGRTKKETQHLKFFGRPSQLAPSLGIEQASQEVKKMAALVHTTLHMTQDHLKTPSSEKESRALKYEGITDSILQELTVFLAKVMQANLSKKQSFESACLMQFAVELEKIADNCEDILSHIRNQEISEGLSQDVQKYFAAAVDCFEHVFPMLTDHFNIRPESMDAFLTDLENYVNDSLKVYDELLLQGLRSHQDYNRAIPVFNSIRKIVENTHSIVDLRQRFLLPIEDLERL